MVAISLRERKKDMIRQEVISTAERLFEERGYDAVTVAEIADAANISVKTLFTYFRSKEDLLFQDTILIDNILTDLETRKAEDTLPTAVANTLTRLMEEKGASADSLAKFQKGYGESEALRSRMLKLWDEYESAIMLQLIKEKKIKRSSLDLRHLASQLVTLIRATTWKETYEMVSHNSSMSNFDLTEWLKKQSLFINSYQ